VAKKAGRKVTLTKGRREPRRKREQAISKKAIRQLQSVSENYSGSAVARQADALRRTLASPNPSKATTQRRIQTFAIAAADYAPPARATKKTKPSGPKRVAKTAARSKTLSKSPPYKTAVFKCWSDYETCCQHGDWRMCASLAAICIANQLKWPAAGAFTLIKLFGGH
jgi:hypothetical protein